MVRRKIGGHRIIRRRLNHQTSNVRRTLMRSFFKSSCRTASSSFPSLVANTDSRGLAAPKGFCRDTQARSYFVSWQIRRRQFSGRKHPPHESRLAHRLGACRPVCISFCCCTRIAGLQIQPWPLTWGRRHTVKALSLQSDRMCPVYDRRHVCQRNVSAARLAAQILIWLLLSRTSQHPVPPFTKKCSK